MVVGTPGYRQRRTGGGVDGGGGSCSSEAATTPRRARNVLMLRSPQTPTELTKLRSAVWRARGIPTRGSGMVFGVRIRLYLRRNQAS